MYICVILRQGQKILVPCERNITSDTHKVTFTQINYTYYWHSEVLRQPSFKFLFIQLINKAKENGKNKWALIKYETWFDFFLALLMSGHMCPPKVTFPTTPKINWCKTWLALKDDFSRPRSSQLYPLINKIKKKSNQVSYLVSTHLIFSFLCSKHGGALRFQSNIYDGAFCKYRYRLKTLNYFRKKVHFK